MVEIIEQMIQWRWSCEYEDDRIKFRKDKLHGKAGNDMIRGAPATTNYLGVIVRMYLLEVQEMISLIVVQAYKIWLELRNILDA